MWIFREKRNPRELDFLRSGSRIALISRRADHPAALRAGKR